MDKGSVGNETPSTKRRPQLKVSTPLKSGDPNIQYGGITDTDDVPLLSDSFNDKPKCLKIFEYVCTMTIEPVMFTYMFAFVLNISCLTNMMMDKGCLFHFNYSAEVCNNLSVYPDQKTDVEKLANNYSLYSNLMNFIGAFFMVFIAPWSDKYGRKLPLIAGMFGVSLTDLGLIMCTIHFDSRLEYLVLARIPAEIFGGFICVLTIVYSHASEVSTEKTRTIKYTSIEIAFGLGLAMGSLAGGLIYRYYGYFYIYVTSAALHLFALPWVVFFVQETTGLNSTASWLDKAKDFFVLQSFKTGFKATCRAREGNNRALLLLFLASICAIVLTYESFGSIAYVYAHHIYDWNPTIYSLTATVFSLSQLVVTLIAVPVMVKVFKINDPLLGVIGTISLMAKNTLLAFAKPHVYIYYLANISGFMSPLATLAIRAGISKMVDKDELGRVFSFLATCEAVIPMLGTLAVTKIFNATINIYPCISYLMTVVLLVLPLATFIWVYTKRNQFGTLKVNISPAEEISTKP